MRAECLTRHNGGQKQSARRAAIARVDHAVPLFCGTDLGIFERPLATLSRRIIGANLGPRQHCARTDEGKRAPRPGDRSARAVGFSEGWQEDERRRSATGRVQKKEARRHHSRGQKAAVAGDEETVGRAQKEGFLNLGRHL